MGACCLAVSKDKLATCYGWVVTSTKGACSNIAILLANVNVLCVMRIGCLYDNTLVAVKYTTVYKL